MKLKLFEEGKRIHVANKGRLNLFALCEVNLKSNVGGREIHKISNASGMNEAGGGKIVAVLWCEG